MTVCYACGAATRVVSIGISSFDECERCGLARVRGYDGSDDYWHTNDTDADYWSVARASYFRRALDLLEPGNVIDFGGGPGWFAQAATGAGFDAWSLDTSPEATAAAAERLGDHAVSSLPQRRFDNATMWCVVAHVPDPDELLAACSAAVRPGGKLWLTTPNWAFQKHWGRLLAVVGRPMVFGGGDDHLWEFTRSSLTLLLERHGFADVQFVYRGVTEHCAAAGSRSPALIAGKRIWNLATSWLYELGGPLLTSELQVLATHSAL